MKRIFALLIGICLGAPATAGPIDTNSKDFVAANLTAIFYHELGHAFIDIMKLPIYGQEEDAADVLSAVLVHELFQGETALRVAYATALGFRADSENGGGDVFYWDVHGPDLQRYYTFVCLFYGADTRARQGFADDLQLPEGRQQTCEEEFAQASNSWGQVMQELAKNGAGRSMRFLADHRTDAFGKLTADVIGKEVKAMNDDLSLPKSLLVRVEGCGVVNAFYDPKTREIIMCTEFARALAEMAPR